MSKIPVLFLAFNRPNLTEQSFRCIRRYKPKKLYVALDGPRSKEEEALCNEVKRVIDNIDWDCEVQHLVRETNLGCKNAINEAIDWFFTHEEMGIIYEDDLVVSPSFFEFCSICLEKYKNDNRIMLITGNNLLGEYESTTSYFFSRIGAIWGWATWKRAWLAHDKKMSLWPKAKEIKALNQVLPNEMVEERTKIFDKVFTGEIDTWDYQFTFTRLINSGLSIIPSRNLVQNIGFGEDATHTTTEPIYISNTALSLNTDNITHPSFVIPNNSFDYEIFLNRTGKPMGLLQRIRQKLNTRLNEK